MKRLIRKADAEIDTTDYLSHLDKVDEEVEKLWAASKIILEESDTLDDLPKSYFGIMTKHNNPNVEANFYALTDTLRGYISKIDRLSQSIRKSIDVK